MFKLNIYIKYLFQRSFVKILCNSEYHIASTANLSNVEIFVAPGAKLYIGKNAKISNTIICVEKGECVIGDNSIIGKNSGHPTKIIINNGSMIVGDHSKLTLSRIWIRFGGKCQIGSYTNINEESEIRCDESISIGSYNQISYGVRIWDTNTHSILTKDERREMTRRYFPYFGYEKSRPKTSPIIIGDDCWIGEKASILKGTKIGNEVVCGYNCLLSGQEIPDNSQVVSKVVLDVKARI